MNGIARCHRAALAVVATFMAAPAQGGLEPPPATPSDAPVFTRRFTPDDPHDPGIRSGHRVLVAADLPLRG